MRFAILAMVPVLILTFGNVSTGQQIGVAGNPPQMKLSSPEFKDMEPIPLKYTQTGTRRAEILPDGMVGASVSPPFEWTNVPPGTNAFVLMMVDHQDTMMWAVVNIPGDIRSLPEAIPNGNSSTKLPAGAFHKSYRTNGWIGSAAGTTPEGVWTYYYTLYPLSKRLDLPVDASIVKCLVSALERCWSG